MKKLIGIAVVLWLAATPALAQKVTIDYAHEFDFKPVKTFLYVDTPDTDVQNPMMADRIVGALKRELVEIGLTEVQEDPDLVVTYQVTTQENQVLTTTGMGWGGAGMGGGWGGWGGGGMAMGTSTTRAHTSTEGTLVLDAYDPVEKKLVWRGMGTVTLKGKPENQIKQIDKVLKKLGSRWEKILAGKGK